MVFSLLVALGSILGLAWIHTENFDDPDGKRVNIGIWALAGALAGARIAYISVNWGYFQTHLVEVFQPWLGGLSWPGALAGGLLTVAVIAFGMGIPLGTLADDLLPLLLTLSVAVWLGCWIEGCAYGPKTNLGLPTQDAWGLWENRFPVQLIGSFLTIALFGGIEILRSRGWYGTPGLGASLGVGGLSLILWGASLQRADPYPLYEGLRLETWAAIFFLGSALLSGLWVWFRNRR